MGPDRMLRLKTATQEAFVNCIRYGSTGDSLHPVSLDAEIYATHLRLRIRHKGPAFDPLAVPSPSFDGSRDSGFGTYIIMRSADELEYLREGDVNTIIISIFRGGE
jgi:anti-sigma regulatory factor (Ser/Thr protein kinase)